VRTRRSEQCFGNAKLLLKQSMAFFGKRTVSRKLPVSDGFLNEIKFFSRKERSIKWNAQRGKISFKL
jgi:hypothetical protein